MPKKELGIALVASGLGWWLGIIVPLLLAVIGVMMLSRGGAE